MLPVSIKTIAPDPQPGLLFDIHTRLSLSGFCKGPQQSLRGKRLRLSQIQCWLGPLFGGPGKDWGQPTAGARAPELLSLPFQAQALWPQQARIRLVRSK
jgi:hypothetical protein